MAFFKQGVPTEYLILGEAGHIPIETITAWSVSDRLDYAWKMDNSHKAQSYVTSFPAKIVPRFHVTQ